MSEQFSDKAKERGQKDTLKGKMKKAGGKIEEKVGELTGDEKARARGAAKETGGSAQSALGKGEDKAGRVIDRKDDV